MVWYIEGGRRRWSTKRHITQLYRRDTSTGESKTNFEWDRWLSVGCQAGPSTPCIPLLVGSCRGNSRQAAEVQRAGSLLRSSSAMLARRYTKEEVKYAYLMAKMESDMHISPSGLNMRICK
eukprot:scaffold42846_cov50-Cyclotella_meneghiniana.AAC.2